VRIDGRKMHNAYLFEVKKPEESRYPGDFYKLRATTGRPLGGIDRMKVDKTTPVQSEGRINELVAGHPSLEIVASRRCCRCARCW
jgi:hypothetical protein